MTMDVNNVSGAQNVYQTTETGRVAYQPKIDMSDPEDTTEFSTKNEEPKKSGVGKKLGTALASAIIPGFGQLINGDIKSAAKHFFGSMGCGVLSGVGVGLAAACPPVGIACALAGSIGTLGIYVHGIADAYKEA